MSRPAVVFDFDETIAATAALAPFRDKRDWVTCEQLAPSIPLFDGIAEALQTLADRDHRLYIATASPRKYLDLFLERLPPVFASTLTSRKVWTYPGLSYRASVKRDQLGQILAKEKSRVVMVSNDASDAAASALVGIPFIHACWGGSCGDIKGFHAKCIVSLVSALERL